MNTTKGKNDKLCQIYDKIVGWETITLLFFFGEDFNGNNHQKITWLNEEFELLKKAINASERDKIEHRLYDILYIIFEIVADNNFDLDKEWQKGRHRKQEKYLKMKN